MRVAETEVEVGDFYQTHNGNIYLALPDLVARYICNEDYTRSAMGSKKLIPRICFVTVKVLSQKDFKKLLPKGDQ